MVEQCGGKVNIDSGTVWWNSGTLIVEQCGGTVEQSWWKSVVEQWNSPGGTVWWTVEQSWWNSVVEQ